MQQAFAYCEQLVREHERDRFLASLYAPGDRRPALFALYAFEHELARVGERVREPLAGEVRLQWWREALDGRRAEEAVANPVAAALLATLAERRLPRLAVEAFIDARTFDIYAEPMETLAQFDRYARDTAGGIAALAALALGAPDDARLQQAALHAGAAAAGLDALTRFPAHAARGRLYIPREVLARHGAELADAFAGKASAPLRAALADMRAHVRRHFGAARALAADLGAPARPAFLHLSATELALARMERADYDPFTTPIEVPRWRRQWRLWRAARAL